MPRLAQAEEVAGLYRFNLAQPPALPGNSTVRVPFQQVALQAFEMRATLEPRFDARARPKGVLDRQYQLVASQPLLGARVMVRERDYIVGQTQWTETAAGQDVSFELGRDPDVTYARTVELQEVRVQPELSISEDGDKVKLTHYTYQVTYVLRNAKARDVDFRISEGRRVLRRRRDDRQRGASLRGPSGRERQKSGRQSHAENPMHKDLGKDCRMPTLGMPGIWRRRRAECPTALNQAGELFWSAQTASTER